MSRSRVAILGAVLVVFAIVGGVLIFANQAAGGKDVSISVTVTGAKSMAPSDLSAHHNDNITINITSDTDGELHLHGYDIHFETKAGQVVSKTFKAVNTGDFEIEWGATSTHLGHLVVT